jgi:pSer/pThr/pTyr-binding forkhead associated (FHA) protein
VSALYTQPGFPVAPDDDDIDALDRTVVTRRRRIPWALVPPSGVPIDLTSDVVILGRRPSADAAHPDAQLVSIADETRTVSKTHARLHLRGDTWYVTDLDSTNGVLFATLMGTEVEAPPGEEIEAGERFFLGDAEVRLTRSEP